MSIQFIVGNNQQPSGIFMSIEIWESLDQETKTKILGSEVSEWEAKMISKGLSDLATNKDEFVDLREFLEQALDLK